MLCCGQDSINARCAARFHCILRDPGVDFRYRVMQQPVLCPWQRAPHTGRTHLRFHARGLAAIVPPFPRYARV